MACSAEPLVHDQGFLALNMALKPRRGASCRTGKLVWMTALRADSALKLVGHVVGLLELTFDQVFDLGETVSPVSRAAMQSHAQRNWSCQGTAANF